MKTRTIVGAVALVLAASAVSAADAQKEVRAENNAKLSLTDAIKIAEKEGSGKAVDAELESAKAGHAVYAVEVLSSDGKKLTEYKLDGNTGKVQKASNEPLEKLVTRVKPEDIRAAPTSLSAAIHAAEEHSGGKVVDAETEGNANTLRYDLKVAMADGKTDKIKVDGATGKVTSK